MSGHNQPQRAARESQSSEQEGREERAGLSAAPPAFNVTAATPNDGGNNSGPSGNGPIQRQVIQRQMRRGESTTQSVAILQELGNGTNTAAMRAVVRAIDQTLQRQTTSGSEINIVCIGGGDQFNLQLTEEDARVMRGQLSERAQQIGQEAEYSAYTNAGEPAEANSFTRSFNEQFASILPALRAAAPVSSGPDATDPRSQTFTHQELNELFTANQRAKLATYMQPTHFVPDRLFTEGDMGSANSQQRTLIASHILAHGVIQRGSLTQRIHARMCGHWVELVYNYAGNAITEGRGIEFSFDHEGQASMGAGRLDHEFEGERRTLTEDERAMTGSNRRFRRGAFPFEEFDTLRPGDWVYVFTDTNTSGGDHSGIFSHFTEGPQVSRPRREEGEEGQAERGPGLNYRTAVIFSQRSPGNGGTEDTWVLSDRDGTVNGRSTRTVSRVVRHREDAHAPETVAEVEQTDLGVRGGRRSSSISNRNDRYIRNRGRRGHPVDRQALITFIQESNRTLLARLEAGGRVTENQMLLWETTNQTDDIEVLVRLNERINNLALGSETLDTAMQAEHERVAPRREAAQAEADARRIVLERDLEAIGADITRMEDAMNIGEEARPLIAQRNRLRTQLRWHRSRLGRARRSQRAGIRATIREKTAQRDELQTQIDAIHARRDAALEEARGELGNWRTGGRNDRQRLNRLRGRRDRFQEELDGLDEAGGYETAHPGRQFRGANSGRARLTGLLENLNPAPNWRELQVAQE